MFSLELMQRIDCEMHVLFVDLDVMVTTQVNQIAVVVSLRVGHRRVESGGCWLFTSNVRCFSKNYWIAASRRINSQQLWANGKRTPIAAMERQKEFC